VRLDPSTWQGKAAILVNAAASLALLLLCMRLDKIKWRPSWPHFDIMKNGQVYLRRYFLVRWRAGVSVFLHNIRHEDDDRDPHDHPRSFLTIVLRGGYTDECWKKCEFHTNHPPHGMSGVEHLRVGSIRLRKAEHIHRVRDVLPNTWTLTIWGPYRRTWGFWNAEWAFVPWREYLNIRGPYDGD
jgi:hypothetical protein